MREEGVLFRRGKGGLNQTDDGAKGERPTKRTTNGAARRKGFRRPKEECSGRFLRPRFQIVQNGECPSYCVIGRNGCCLPSLPSLLSAIIRVIVGLAASRSARTDLGQEGEDERASPVFPRGGGGGGGAGTIARKFGITYEEQTNTNDDSELGNLFSENQGQNAFWSHFSLFLNFEPVLDALQFSAAQI